MRRFIDEYLEPKEEQWLVPNFQGITNRIFDYFENGLSPGEIVKRLQEDLYIFTDEKETEWETEVVCKILEGQPVTNRYTGEVFNWKQI